MLFILLFGFWLLLNGAVTLEIILTGAVLSALITAFSYAFLGLKTKLELRMLKSAFRAVCYVLWLIKEVMLSAAKVVKLIWSPLVSPQPVLVTFKSRLKTRTGKVILADSITLTPGTVTAALSGDTFTVHCLDESMAEGLADGDMVQKISLLEGGKPHE